MPNWAFGNVKVTGTREGVKSFVERFISSDDQSTVPGKRFFARSFSEQKREQSVKDAMEEFEGKADNETAEHSFLIMFAWSVWSCMIDGYPQRNDAECITLSEACMEDHVAVEIRSTETGMCFEEHVTCDEDGNLMCEVKAAKRIVSMLLQEGFDEIRDLDEKIDRAEKNLHQRLAPSQRNAVKLCLSYPISIMTGGPGSGKTTTLRFILDIYQAAFPSNEILLAAPTGRASRRMSEQTGKYASTLHSALGLVTEEDSPLNDTEMLSADLIVVDEFSMVDMRLAYVLMERIKPGAQLIIVGDADQLPSVGAGNVLREMIRSEKVPTAVLETVFRQASNSRIITNAHAINHNDTHLQYGDDFQMLEVQNSEEAARLVIKNYLREVAIHGIENVQILSPFRKRGAVASNALNETIRELVNPPNNLKKEMKCGSRVFRVGDRIMQTVNRINVSNGDVGIITDVETEDDDTIARVKLLDGRELSYTQEMLEDLEFSYCTTIHKSQGQEYPVIIVPLLKEHYIMLRRNLLYTAVTRAKAKVILIGQKQAVFIAIHKCDVGQRNTVLADRIVAYYNRELSKRVT